MKRYYKYGQAILLFLVVSCESSVDQDLDNSIIRKNYSLLREIMARDLGNIITELKNPESINDKSTLQGVIKSYYRNSQVDDLLVLVNNESTNYGSRSNDQVELSSYQQNQIESIMNFVSEYVDIEPITLYLEERFDHYLNADIPDQDKQFMLSYVVTLNTVLTIVKSNEEFLFDQVSNGRSKDAWGCAAGIAGGVAVTVAVVGALVNPPLWVLAPAEWYVVSSAGAASVLSIQKYCF